MTARDFRCLVSGVSLLGAPCVVVLLARQKEALRPVALPLVGRYLGSGFPQDLDEGPNCQLILEALLVALDDDQLVIDWDGLGIEPFAVEDLESFLSLVAYGQMHAPEAIALFGAPLSFSLLEANVAATLMEREPEGLDGVPCDELPEWTLGAHPISRAIYGRLPQLPIRLRLKFGLSFVGLLALEQGLARLGTAWQHPGPGLVPDPVEQKRWLAEAWIRFADQEDLIEALDDYGQEDELSS